MPAHLTMLWQTLSARLRHDPEILALRLDHLEGRVSTLEQTPHQEPNMVETPVGPMPLKLVIIGLLLLAIFRPDLLSKLIP